MIDEVDEGMTFALVRRLFALVGLVPMVESLHSDPWKKTDV
jgi:hypothetical protein